jgi:hypothetical protein
MDVLRQHVDLVVHPIAVVAWSVWGMSATSKLAGPIEATVRLTPSSASEPFSTTNGRSASGSSKDSRR